MLFKSILRMAAVFAAVSLSQNTFAGSYWGIGLGSSSWTLKPLHGAYELDNGATLDLVFGRKSGHLGFEGEFTFSSHDWKNYYGSATHNVGNLILAGMAYLPLGQSFELYGKIGADLWRTTVDYSGTTYDGDNGFSAVVGAGVNINITRTTGLRLEYKQMNGLGDGVDKGDIKQGTALVILKL